MTDSGNQVDRVFAAADADRAEGRISAAVEAVCALGRRHPADAPLVLRCAAYISDCQRDAQLLALCETGIASGIRHPHLYGLAAQAAAALGEFERARRWLLAAASHDLQEKGFLALNLSKLQRYDDSGHPDFALFEQLLGATTATTTERAGVLFAMGKALDDVADYPRAAQVLRQGNGIMREMRFWSRHSWRRQVQSGLLRTSAEALGAAEDFVPVFIVGLPRSGTTLVAERLSRDVRACNRDEPGWLPHLLERLPAQPGRQELQDAALEYRLQMRQDDAPARYYIDKDEHNFRYLGLASRMFPNLRVIWCRRRPRDMALSIWSHYFSTPEFAYASDFANISAFLHGSEQMMRHWIAAGIAVHVVDYERMVAEHDQVVAGVRDFVGLQPAASAEAAATRSIATASRWQVRQPIYAHAVERWRNYADCLPELLQAFPG